MDDRPPATGFDAFLGLRYDDAGPDRVRASLEIRPALLQPYGILHGGVLCSVVESVGSLGAALWFADRGQVVGVGNHTSFVRATREGVLHATGTPVHRGRTQQLWTVEITDAADRLIAKGELRVANLTDAGRLGTAGAAAAPAAPPN